MNDIIALTENLMHIARNFAFIANGQCKYIKYGNPWKIPNEKEWEIEIQ